MCSTPPATTSCAAPLTTACAPKFTACSAEPQNRFTVVPGTSTGRPAASTAPRAMFMPCSPTCVTHPMITSSTSSGLTPARSSAPVSVRASRSTGCNAVSAPLRLPRAVRTASTMIASPTVASQSSGMTKWILANDGLGALGADRNGDRLDPDQRPVSDARGVRLGDADDRVDGCRTDPGAHRSIARHRIGGGDVRIRSMVDVEQGPLGPLEEHRTSLRHLVREDLARVPDVGAHALAELQRPLDQRLQLALVAAERLDLRVRLAHPALQLVAQPARLAHGAHPDPAA